MAVLSIQHVYVNESVWTSIAGISMPEMTPLKYAAFVSVPKPGNGTPGAPTVVPGR
jgi:hypothetical protein